MCFFKKKVVKKIAVQIVVSTFKSSYILLCPVGCLRIILKRIKQKMLININAGDLLFLSIRENVLLDVILQVNTMVRIGMKFFFCPLFLITFNKYSSVWTLNERFLT